MQPGNFKYAQFVYGITDPMVVCAFGSRDSVRRDAALGSRSERRRRRLRKEDLVANYQVGYLESRTAPA